MSLRAGAPQGGHLPRAFYTPRFSHAVSTCGTLKWGPRGGTGAPAYPGLCEVDLILEPELAEVSADWGGGECVPSRALPGGCLMASHQDCGEGLERPLMGYWEDLAGPHGRRADAQVSEGPGGVATRSFGHAMPRGEARVRTESGVQQK